jgi:(2Fe-2S) ferredoxin
MDSQTTANSGANSAKKPEVKKLERHVFVCTNQRAEGHPRGCCQSKGSEEILKKLKEKVAAAGLQSKIRVQKSGCLDVCESGAAMVVYPEGIWYGSLNTADPELLEQRLNAIVETHLKGGVSVKELLVAGK